MKRNFRYITKFEEQTRSARLQKRGYGLKATDVIGYAWEGELLTVEFVKHLFKTKQVEFDADSLKGRKDMNGIPEGLTANGEEYMPIFGSTELDKSDRKMLEEGRSSSARLETREAFNPIYYEYGVFQVKKEQVAFWNEVENETDENGNPITVGWYFNFRRGRTKDSDTAIGGVFKSKSEATNALNERIEEERKKWEATEGRSSSAGLETRMASKPQPRSDKESEREIALEITNNYDKESGRLKSIIENLARKMNKQNYDKALASKLYAYLVEDGVKSYIKEFGKGSISLSPASRLAIGVELEEYYVDDVEAKANQLAGIDPQQGLIDAESKRLDWKQNSSSTRLETRELDAFNEKHLRKWIDATVASSDEFSEKEIDVIYDHMMDTYNKDPEFWADQGWRALGDEVEVFALASNLRKQQ